MLRRLWLLLAGGLAGSALASAPAWAQASTPARAAQDDARERSRAAFRRGVAQAEAGDYVAARDSFELAYRLYPHPSILLNLGIARAHTGQWVEAEQDLLRFLADDGAAQPDELASARAELAQTREHLGTFRLHVAPGGARAMLDARAIALIPGGFVDVRATRGTHDLHVEADGYAPVDRRVVVAGERAPDVDIELAPVASPGGETTPPPVGGRAAPAPPGEATRAVGWFLASAGAVAAGVGVYSGLEAISLANAYNTVGSGSYQDQGTKQRGLVFRTAADAAFAGAIVLGGLGAYVLLTSPEPSRARVALVLGPGCTGVSGRF
jgi:tetratricopeptide (TPR) repeat protein